MAKRFDQYDCVLARIKLQARAYYHVKKAIRDGIIKQLDGSIKCSDCDSVATQYDHRDYSKPLKVQPVCRSCNTKRVLSIDAKKMKAKITHFLSKRGEWVRIKLSNK